MMGNIGHIANFDVKIRIYKKIFYMMGNSQLKMIVTGMLSGWAG